MGRERPNVTLLTEYFHPEEASTAQLLTSLATGLTGCFDVSVLTTLPSYHEDDRTSSPPRDERYRNVAVRRVCATRFDKDRLPMRLLNWASFVLLAFVSLLVSFRDDDVRVVLSNPPVLPIVTWLGKRIQGIPYVYVIYDVYPEMPIEQGYVDADGPVARVWHRLMRAIYRDADRIVVLDESMERHLLEKHADDPEFDPEKVVVIPNWEDPSFIRPKAKADNEFATEHGFDDQFTLLYSGNIGRFHEIETAIDAIGELEDRGRTDVQLVVIGEGARKDELESYVQNRGIQNVQFLPFQPMDRVPETLTAGDASLVGIKARMEGLCVSSKLYSSLAAGKPILAVVGRDDEVARVVRTYDCGSWVEPGNSETAADVLAAWADDLSQASRLGDNARQCLERQFCEERAISDYESLLEELV
jgi:glycosyltransferase involved in cell wall biosynthesis